jgi:hypothetical protein
VQTELRKSNEKRAVVTRRIKCLIGKGAKRFKTFARIVSEDEEYHCGVTLEPSISLVDVSRGG